jgi:iron complex transport system substrate-binding protein
MVFATGYFNSVAGASRMVADQVGRSLEIPAIPNRVVALAPSVTEIIFALGRQNRLVGATRFSDHPEAANKLPKVGSYIHLDVERIVALQPDLCIGIKDGNPLAVVKQLDQIGIPVYAINPIDLKTVMQSVSAIGMLMNAEQEARRIVTGMQTRIDQIGTQVATSEKRPKVFFQIGISPIVSVGTATFIHELIVMAGGTNVSAGSTPYPRYSKEQVIDLAPDVIVISSMARKAIFEKVKAEWQQWPVIPAVTQNAVYIAPTNLFDRPTPRLVDGLELLARLIHPKLFSGQIGQTP